MCANGFRTQLALELQSSRNALRIGALLELDTTISTNVIVGGTILLDDVEISSNLYLAPMCVYGGGILVSVTADIEGELSRRVVTSFDSQLKRE